MSVFHEILKQYWGYSDFRSIQLDIIESISAGRDTLGLMPTGGGKSLTFQVPALTKDGICIVVTPLVALMKDQVERLKSMNIRAACIYSGMSAREIMIVLDNCLYGDFKFLYVSPERLGTDLFQERLGVLSVSMLVVDEAHCISQWGYDFRPSYLKIAEIRELLPNVPILALTATATPEVVMDIQKSLHFAEPNVFKMSFERQNLAYVVRRTDNKEKMLLTMLDKVAGTAIVYVRTRSRTKEIATILNSNGVNADYYHAGLTDATKNAKQQAWKKGDCRVMVSTNAFGMGIDKADVRLVVHCDMPDSLEAYYQEAGRAGRDGKKAYAVLLFQPSDATQLKKRVSDTFPQKDYVRKVYDSLCYYYQLALGCGQGVTYAFDLMDFCTKYHLNAVQAFNALKIIQQAGYIELTDEQDGHSRVYFTMDRDALYQMEGIDKKTEMVLQVLLRSYTGLFADYVHIEETLLGQRLGMNSQEVYMALKTLSSFGVLHYIPKRRTPYIIYTRMRVDGKYLKISKAVYEDRKRRFEERISAIIGYASDDSICRSKRLMHYFGQTDANDCKQCDVCLKKTDGDLRHYEAEQIKEAICAVLSQNPSSLEKLIDDLPFDSKNSLQVLRFLCDNGMVKLVDFKYFLAEKDVQE